MKVCALYTFLALSTAQLLVAHSVKSQSLDEINVTVGLSHESLGTLFQQIQTQTGLLFAYQQPQIAPYSDLILPEARRSVKATLDLVFTGTQLRYRQVNNSVVIYLAEPEPEQSRIPITGIVKDKTGSPIPGVSVFIKGTTTGTTTDAEGRYSIDLPAGLSGTEGSGGYVLVFSFIGYKTTEEVVGARLVVDLTLEEDTKVLDEVVINGGYYETTDKLKTGSIVKVTAKDIERQPLTSPLLALQGRVPGLEITPQSGAPGAAPKIRIRGLNSLRQDQSGPLKDGNYPLFVIDGVPINSEPLNNVADLKFSNSPRITTTSSGYDPLSTLNMSNIESIEVLKDGDATSMYGSRGANGVILITTKRNSKSATSFDASFYTGIGRISKELKLLNSSQYLEMRHEALANSGLIPGEVNLDVDLRYWDTTRYTNWQKELLGGSSNIYDAQAGISFGNKNTSFRLSGGYHSETLLFPGDFGYRKITGQLSVNHVSTDQRFKLSVASIHGLDENQSFGGPLVSDALTLPPIAPKLYKDDGSLNWEQHTVGAVSNQSTFNNPLASLLRTSNANTWNNISTVNLGYEFLPGLVGSASLAYTDLYNREVYKNPKSANPPQLNVQGTSQFSQNKRTVWITEPNISYIKKIGKHNLNAVAGTTFQKSTNMAYQVSGEGYLSDALLGSLQGAKTIRVALDEIVEYKFNSLYARLGYNWNDRYIVNLTGRRDGSSRFGPGKRFGNFGSIGAAWLFSNENWIKSAMPFLSLGKIRGSYGSTGSDNIGDYNYYSLYNIIDGNYGGVTTIAPYALHNPNYAWEVTKKLEGAVELSFFDNRFGLEVAYYRNRSSNQLVNYSLSTVTGFESVLMNFDATIENSGLETMLRGEILSSDNLTWNASFNISLPSNKLVSFDGIEDSPYATVYRVGDPLTVRFVYTWTGVDPQTGVHTFKDYNNDGLINDLDKKVRNLSGNPYYGGINNTLRYKSFELTFLFQFVHQRAERYITYLPGLNSNQPIDVLNRWQESGDQTDIQKYSTFYNKDGITLAGRNFNELLTSDYNSVDASFIRLKVLSITYGLPSSWLSRVKLQDVKVFLQGQNLLTFTGYGGLDPESGSALPPLKMITAGLQLKL